MEDKILELLEEVVGDDIRSDMDQELFDSGLLDSLDFTFFIVKIEDELGITISPTELEREQIDTPRKIVDEVTKRKV